MSRAAEFDPGVRAAVSAGWLERDVQFDFGVGVAGQGDRSVLALDLRSGFGRHGDPVGVRDDERLFVARKGFVVASVEHVTAKQVRPVDESQRG